MLKEIVFVLWFFLPAGMANMMPIFAAHLPYLNRWSFPLDGYAMFRGRRIFGDHKTLRGLLSGIVAGIGTACIQWWLYQQFPLVRTFVEIDYTIVNPLFFGLLASTGALAGDAAKSFLKRQMRITPGESWFPYDQFDYILGGLVFTLPIVQLHMLQYVLLVVVWFGLHLIATVLGYAVHLKESPI